MSRTNRYRHPHCTSGSPSVRTAPSVRHWLEGCGRHGPLPPRTVLELSRRIQSWRNHPAGPDAAPCQVRRRALRARNQLAAHNLRLISHTWKRHGQALPAHDEGTADALQEAALQLLRAAEKYDPTRGYSFSTYATFWVRHGFSVHQRTQRRLIRLPGHRLEMLMRLRRLAAQYSSRHGDLPSMEWLAQCCGPRGRSIPIEDLQRLLLQWQLSCPLELDRPIARRWEEHEPIHPLENLPDPRGVDPTLSAAAALELSDCPELADFPDASALLGRCAGDGHDPQRALLPQLLRVLSPAEHRLLWHRYLREHPLTVRQLQKLMGLSPARQEEIEQRALGKLREAARAAGMAIQP